MREHGATGRLTIPTRHRRYTSWAAWRPATVCYNCKAPIAAGAARLTVQERYCVDVACAERLGFVVRQAVRRPLAPQQLAEAQDAQRARWQDPAMRPFYDDDPYEPTFDA